MSIGYACLVLGIPEMALKSCIMRNASEEKLLEIIEHNLIVLEQMINYNIDNNIKLFRISSDLIPFGSSSVNQLPWGEIFEQRFKKVGEKILSNDMRVSMHPGQYTVLNSPNSDVVERAYEDLNYHGAVLDSLGIGNSHKIILHIGGIYNDKAKAIRRFINEYGNLDDKIKNRLVIENDDKLFNINDVLEISQILDVPVIYDNLHNKINKQDNTKDDYYWIDVCNKTWSLKDGKQKIHYSQQDTLKKPGSHSNTIRIDEFMSFYKRLKSKDIDIMLEVKDKNLSAVKCINATTTIRSIKNLELEWQKYKYSVLESSPADYIDIRNLLKDKKAYPVIDFYRHIENGLQKDMTIGHIENAALHVWGYFKDVATDKEKEQFLKKLNHFKNGSNSIKHVKNYLKKLAEKYNEEYLLKSYYFLI